MRNILQKIDGRLYQLENILIFVIMVVMVLLAFLQVLLRNIFDTGLLWADIFLRHLVLWVGFIGAALATRSEKHINIDLLSRIVSRRYLLPVKTVTRIFNIMVCLILAWASYAFVMSEKEAGTIVFENIPAWYLQIIIPIGFGLIAFRFLLKILEDFTAQPQDPK